MNCLLFEDLGYFVSIYLHKLDIASLILLPNLSSWSDYHRTEYRHDEPSLPWFCCCLVAIMRRIIDCFPVSNCSSCTKLVYLRNLLDSLHRSLGGHDCSFSIFRGHMPPCPLFRRLCTRGRSAPK